MERDDVLMYQLMDALPQPAFCCRAGVVCYRNPAARDKLIQEGQSLQSMLMDGELHDLESMLEQGAPLDLLLCGHRYETTVLRSQDLLVVLVEPEAAEALRPDMLLSISQSLRSPLTELFSASSGLFPMLEELENPVVQQKTAVMNRAMYQLLRLTGNLSHAGAAMLDSMHLLREKVEVTEYFYQLFQRIGPLCREAGVEFSFEIPQQTFPGWLDPQRVQQAVLNLVSNAIKFSVPQGKITARLTRTATSRIQIRIIDNGEGLREDVLSSAFTRYNRPSGLEDPRWGVGFGLYLVRHIASLHGGAVVLQSREGGGTEVTLALSIKEPTSQETRFHSPMAGLDYTGGFDHDLVELSDALPTDMFNSLSVN